MPLRPTVIPRVLKLDVARALKRHKECTNRLRETFDTQIQLDDAQTAAFAVLRDRSARGLFIVVGGPGTGKSVIARLFARERCLHDGVVLMGITNENSALLSAFADTVHTTCDISFRGTVIGSGCGSRNPEIHHSLATCRTFIIDEVFMMTSDLFRQVLHRIAQAQGTDTGTMLARTTILLVGDEKQLPPAQCRSHCKYVADVCDTHHIASDTLFKQTWQDQQRCFRLQTNHRNPGFAHVLPHIANQHVVPLTQAWFDEHVNCLCRVTERSETTLSAATKLRCTASTITSYSTPQVKQLIHCQT